LTGDEAVNEVTVWRGDTIESRHTMHVAVVSADGDLHAFAGDPEFMTFARSAVKPIQALPLIEDGVIERFGLTDEELALCCASHSGEPMHVALAASILSKIGTGAESLACGPHEPFDHDAADALRKAGEQPTRLHNNCSGKHAGMLALARARGWLLSGYHEPHHPVQQRMLVEMARWTGVSARSIATGVDGCGVVTFGVPLQRLAAAFAALARASRRNEGAGARVTQVMMRYPQIVAGTNRMCTELMRVAAGRIFVKVGAEGVYCAGVPGAEIGVAVKAQDGGQRAAETGLLAVLRTLGVLDDEEMTKLQRWSRPDVRNTRKERVGRIESNITLTPAS
jgi:L-asparaginase II